MATDVKLSSEFTIIYGGEVIAYCTDFTLEKNKEIVDITKLGDTWKNKKVDMKDFTVSFNGMVTRGDTVTASLWDPATAYSAGNYVVLAGNAYEAQGSTTGDNPTTDDGTNWLETSDYSAGTTYAAGDLVYYQGVGNEKRIYISLQGSNTGNDPTTETAYWERLTTNYESLLNELAYNDTLVKVTIKPTAASETYFYGEGVLNSLSASFGVGDKVTYSGGFAGSGILTAATGGYNATYQAVYDAMTNKPSSAVAAAQNTLVASLISAGIWSKFDGFWLFAQESNDDDEALINWADPGTYDAVFVDTPAFTSLEGLAGNGSSDAIDCIFRPSVDGVNFTQDDNSFGAYSRTNVSEAAALVGQAGGQNYIYPRHPSLSNIAIARGGDTANLESADLGDSSGMWIVSRTASNARAFYRNKSLRDSDTDVAVANTSSSWWFLAIHSGAGLEWSTHQISFGFVASGLTSGEADDLTDAIEVYMDSNSKGVIA